MRSAVAEVDDGKDIFSVCEFHLHRWPNLFFENPFECIGLRLTDYVNVSNSIFKECDSMWNLNSEMEIKNGRKNFVIDCTARHTAAC